MRAPRTRIAWYACLLIGLVPCGAALGAEPAGLLLVAGTAARTYRDGEPGRAPSQLSWLSGQQSGHGSSSPVIGQV